jgi:hypothetical protein
VTLRKWPRPSSRLAKYSRVFDMLSLMISRFFSIISMLVSHSFATAVKKIPLSASPTENWSASLAISPAVVAEPLVSLLLSRLFAASAAVWESSLRAAMVGLTDLLNSETIEGFNA